MGVYGDCLLKLELIFSERPCAMPATEPEAIDADSDLTSMTLLITAPRPTALNMERTILLAAALGALTSTPNTSGLAEKAALNSKPAPALPLIVMTNGVKSTVISGSVMAMSSSGRASASGAPEEPLTRRATTPPMVRLVLPPEKRTRFSPRSKSNSAPGPNQLDRSALPLRVCMSKSTPLTPVAAMRWPNCRPESSSLQAPASTCSGWPVR